MHNNPREADADVNYAGIDTAGKHMHLANAVTEKYLPEHLPRLESPGLRHKSKRGNI
jgi:hypothetical protein